MTVQFFTYLVQFSVIAFLGWWVYALERDLEDAQADADMALDKALAIEAHLTGLEPEGVGRHASPKPQSYESPTWPGAATTAPILDWPGSRVGGSGEAARPPTDEGD